MTTQPELDLTHGFISLVPKTVQDNYKGREIELEVSKTLDNPKAKCSIKKINLSYDLENRSKWKHRESTHLRIWISHKDEAKNSVMAQYAARHLDNEDDRFAEYRAQFAAVVKHLYANGQLAFVPTQEQLDKPTGFRWNQKAGCRCGCSPAWVAPSWLKLKNTNTITVSVEEKADAEVSLAINTARLESLKTSKPDLANA